MEALGRWDSDCHGPVFAHGQSWLAVGEVAVARRGSPWVGWSWLAMGGLGSL